VTVSSLAEPLTPGSLSLRNEPVQARSTARLAGLLDAAAAVIDELGYERLTTAMVAERAGASIGTVYRYFPDRIAVLQALAARNLERTLDHTVAEINKPEYTTWADALDAALAVYVDAFRTEPGFRSLRVGDVIDLRPVPNEHTFNSIVADAVHGAAAARFGIPADDNARFLFECAVELADAMASRAFLYSPDGDQAFLDAGRNAVHALFDDQFS
jgi:AcrR family transcriptional regulator